VILKDKERIVWEQETEIPEYCDDLVVVPLSDPVQLGDLQPLCLRGTNYLPRQFPWPGLWREATEKTFDEEFDLMKDLNMNSFRTFYFFDEEAQLVRRDGVLTPGLLRKVHTLLDQADQHHLKVMLCLTGSLPHLEEIDTWRRFLRTAVEPFAYDGRVLMWDLINEPGGSDGPKASPELSRWIQTLYPDLERLAPRHLLTVGLCWQFDQLWDLKVKPPVAQYHNYSGAVAVQPEGEPPVRNVADDLRKTLEFVENRPLIIGEFGYATVKDAEREDASEERQLKIYEGVLKGAETAQITGVYNWTLFHFVPDWMGPGEQSFGVVRPDNSLKPAGVLLKKTLGEWRDRARAPWEEKP
jgi:endo-1,4-beta-mannosidase